MKRRIPDWFKRDKGSRSAMANSSLLRDLHLQTICENALCPNKTECFSKRTATFLICGNICTRHCTFCAVKKGMPLPVDQQEAANLADAVLDMRLRYVVMTSVTRDDLRDGGAQHFAECIHSIRDRDESILVEVLIPDFQGSEEALKVVLQARPDVINHNVETVPRLYSVIRPKAHFLRSLEIIKLAKKLSPDIITKSGIMLGLGETQEELFSVMENLVRSGCDILTMGQYLQPSAHHYPVIRYVHPGEFDDYRLAAERMGFKAVASGPLVRSSYKAAQLFETASFSRRR